MEKEEPIDLEYPLLNDYVFKFVFSHEKLHQELLELFEEFINESISFNIDHIHAQELLMAPHYNLKDYYGDVLSVTKDDTIVSLEVYNRFSENEYKKSLCYIARIYGNQLKTKEPYSNAKKVVGISLFNRKIRFNMDNVAEEYKLTEQITRIKTNDEMILFLIDIDKLAKFTYNKCERLRNLAIILKMRWLKDMEKYIENKEDEMLEQTNKR